MLNTVPEGRIKEVRMSIVQPRLDHYDTFTMSANDLLVWGEKVLKPKAKIAGKEAENRRSRPLPVLSAQGTVQESAIRCDHQ